jgi:hypothetical protein
MAWLGYVATAAKVVGTLKAGQAQQAQQEALANQDRVDANTSQVQAQMAAENERRRAKIVRSRALAVAGASGAGANDPTVQNIMTGIESEGELRALNALWEGDTKAQGYRQDAITRRRMGGAIRQASYLNAAGSFFSKYG